MEEKIKNKSLFYSFCLYKKFKSDSKISAIESSCEVIYTFATSTRIGKKQIYFWNMQINQTFKLNIEDPSSGTVECANFSMKLLCYKNNEI